MITIVDFPLKDFLPNNKIKIVQVRRELTNTERIIKKIPLLKSRVINKWQRTNWLDELNGSDIVVLFDTFHDYSLYARAIEESVSQNTRLVLYLWNPILFSNDYQKLSKRWEIWSFSKIDAITINCKYADTFYNEELVIHSNKNKNGIFFVGTEKGRGDILKHIKKELSIRNISSDIRIVDNFKSLYNKEYFKFQPYDKVIQSISETQCLLEINQKGQSGLTLRTMEAIFFGKKLITNNDIVKEYPFYSPNNFFILKRNYSWDNITAFLKTPFVPIEESIKEKFMFGTWLERLINNKEFK